MVAHSYSRFARRRYGTQPGTEPFSVDNGDDPGDALPAYRLRKASTHSFPYQGRVNWVLTGCEHMLIMVVGREREKYGETDMLPKGGL